MLYSSILLLISCISGFVFSLRLNNDSDNEDNYDKTMNFDSDIDEITEIEE